MRMSRTLVLLAGLTFWLFPLSTSQAAPPWQAYQWLEAAPARTIADSFSPPAGFQWAAVGAGSYGDWLRHLPLAPEGTPVRLFDGRPKANQAGAAAVIDIDVGGRDLQQCADAVIRLRAEFLRAAGQREALEFRFTSGDAFAYRLWLEGTHPVVQGNTVSWAQGAAVTDKRSKFRAWLDIIFTYAGTWSLARDSQAVRAVADLAIGDFLVQGGFPGHALVLVDLARDARGRTAVLLAQSYMPAQSIHLVTNLAHGGISPWYLLDDRAIIQTPDWRPFYPAEFRRFPGAAAEPFRVAGK